MRRRDPTQADLMTALTGDAASAMFSPCRTYRYTLTRTWDASRPALVFLMLNPSTADETENDPTVERCQRRAQRMGFGGVVVLNLFALRSTDPEGLYQVEDPVGPENDGAIDLVCRTAPMVICAFGKHGAHQERGRRVLERLKASGVALHALAINLDGSPKHPLYVANDATPIPYG